MKQTFFGKSKELQWKPDNQRAWLQFLEANEGKKLVLEIEQEKSRRSLDQNALYWKYLEIISNETGHTANELHELFKRIFLPPVFKTILGREVKMPATTTDLNKVQFGEYLERINAETGVPIPHKEESIINYPSSQGEITGF